MRQALHIFRKDILYLRIEIGLLLCLAGIMAWAGGNSRLGLAEALLPVIALNLIARLIHAEPIPGDHQFWLTRPYRWKSLLGAKLLFVAAFVTLPVGIMQFAILARDGFSISHELPGLLWTQVLLFAASLLVMALAAITSGMVPFSLLVLILAATALIFGLFGHALPLPVGVHFAAWPVGVEWIRGYTVATALACAAFVMLLFQYRRRQTLLSRVGGAAAIVVCAAIYLNLPLTFALSVQSLLSKQPAPGASVQVALDLTRKLAVVKLLDSARPRVRLPVPMKLTGLPDGVHAKAEALSLTLEWPGRPAWESGLTFANARLSENAFDGAIVMDPALFNQNLEAPMTLRGSVYLTLFGKAESRTIPVKAEPANVQDGLRCAQIESLGRGDFTNFICRSFFRWPSRLVYANAGEEDIDFNNLISYSPFPATLSLDPRENYGVGKLPSVPRVTILTKEPLAYFRRDFEVRGVRLADFHARPAPPRP